MVEGGAQGDRAVFLDRDGVLVVPEFRDGRSFAPRRIADFRLYKEAAPCLERMKTAGFRLVVVTNQPDVGNGLVERAVIEEMHHRLATALPVDAIEVCYHAPTDNCDCRKPKPGMLLRAAARDRVALATSFLLGDRWRDIEAGRRAGCRTILIGSGYGEAQKSRPDVAVATVGEAADWILAQK